MSCFYNSVMWREMMDQRGDTAATSNAGLEFWGYAREPVRFRQWIVAYYEWNIPGSPG